MTLNDARVVVLSRLRKAVIGECLLRVNRH